MKRCYFNAYAWSARVPLDPLFATAINLIQRKQADGGVGRVPGGPPHIYAESTLLLKTKWHWAISLHYRAGVISNPPENATATAFFTTTTLATIGSVRGATSTVSRIGCDP